MRRWWEKESRNWRELSILRERHIYKNSPLISISYPPVKLKQGFVLLHPTIIEASLDNPGPANN